MSQQDAPPVLSFARAEAADGEAMRIVVEGLGAHSAAIGLPGDWTPRWILGRDAEGAIQAGLRYLTAFDWLFVHLLWVAEPCCRRGAGSRLLMEAEAAAREKGCRGAYLDTFSFQAPEFYRRHGYREFGRIADFPPGHARIWFMKQF